MIRWAEIFKYKIVCFLIILKALVLGKGEWKRKKKGQTSSHYNMRKMKVTQRDLIKLGVEKFSNYFSNSSQLFQVY